MAFSAYESILIHFRAFSAHLTIAADRALGLRRLLSAALIYKKSYLVAEVDVLDPDICANASATLPLSSRLYTHRFITSYLQDLSSYLYGYSNTSPRYTYSNTSPSLMVGLWWNRPFLLLTEVPQPSSIGHLRM